jgi:hypothetical protein
VSTHIASNFGTHGNFGPSFFSEGLIDTVLSKRAQQKNKWNKSCRQTFDLK